MSPRRNTSRGSQKCWWENKAISLESHRKTSRNYWDLYYELWNRYWIVHFEVNFAHFNSFLFFLLLRMPDKNKYLLRVNLDKKNYSIKNGSANIFLISLILWKLKLSFSSKNVNLFLCNYYHFWLLVEFLMIVYYIY